MGTNSKRLGRAAAELLVITAGVLLALAADGWRQDMSDRSSEARYLERLSEDLAQDADILEFSMDQYLRKRDLLRQLLDDESRGDVATQAFADRLAASSAGSWNGMAQSNSATFEEMVNSGHLQLIRDAELRAALAGYYDIWEDYRTAIQNRRAGLESLGYQLVRRPIGRPGAERADTATPTASTQDRTRGIGFTDFAAAELSTHELDALAAAIAESDFRRLVTAEMNRAAFAAELFADLRASIPTLQQRLTASRR